VLILSKNWRHHRSWFWFVVLVTVLSTVWYVLWSRSQSTLPGGASWPGFTFGVLGGLIILFEMLLWWRKRVRAWRIGRAQVWMRAHIWLGLLSLPLLILHSGFRFGGDLATILMLLFIVVILSGIWGLAMQQFLPRKMLEEVPAETIYSQIGVVVNKLRDEADRLVLATCGPPEGEVALTGANHGAGEPEPFLTVGAIRSAGKTQGKVFQTRVPSAPVPGTELLRDFHRAEIDPFLEAGDARPSPLQVPSQAAVLFRDLRTKLDPAAYSAIDSLEGLCEQRRQFDYQARLHFWLHCWLWVHLPLSVALVILMVIHIVKASMYW
jgi:hypothetical protein